MKLTLEKALATVRQGLKSPGWDSLDSQIQYFMDDCGFRGEIIAETNKGGYGCRDLSRKWGTLMWLFGLVYRIRIEHDTNVLTCGLGLTYEEDQQVVAALSMLKTKLQSYEKATKNSATKMLYDKISSIGH